METTALKQCKEETSQLDGKNFDNLQSLGSIQYEIPENVRRYTVNPAFLATDTLKLDDLSEKFNEIIDLDNSFKTLVFLEYFLYHALFFFGFGPLLPIICWPFFRNFTIFRNMSFWGLKKDFIFQCFGFCFVFFSVFGCFYFKPSNIYNIEIFGLIILTSLRISIIAIKYAHFSEKKLKYMKKIVLTEEEIESELMLAWGRQKDFVIDKELYTCILKNNIDTSVFRIFFLKPLDKELIKHLEVDEKDLESPDTFSNSATSARQNLSNSKEIWFKSMQIVKKNMMFHNLDGFPGAYSGYLVARYLIKQNNIFQNVCKSLFGVATTLAFINAIIPRIFHFYNSEGFFGNDPLEITLTILILGGNFYYGFGCYAFLIYSIVEIGRTMKFLSQLSNLLSVKRVSLYYEKKMLPTLNIFCPISFKCWIFLNQIFRSYGEKYFKRVESLLGMFLFYNVVLTVILLLSVYNIVNIFDSCIDLIFLCFGILTMFLTIFITLFKGAAINEFYDIHRDILKTNKNIVSDFYNMYGTYFENPNFVSDNEIYYYGVKIFSLYTEKMSPEQKKKTITKHFKILLSLYNDIIEELSFGKERRPFKVFGVPTSKALIKSLLAGLGTVLFAGLQKFIVK